MENKRIKEQMNDNRLFKNDEPSKVYRKHKDMPNNDPFY
jgi:hypothetical protein